MTLGITVFADSTWVPLHMPLLDLRGKSNINVEARLPAVSSVFDIWLMYHHNIHYNIETFSRYYMVSKMKFTLLTLLNDKGCFRHWISIFHCHFWHACLVQAYHIMSVPPKYWNHTPVRPLCEIWTLILKYFTLSLCPKLLNTELWFAWSPCFMVSLVYLWLT